MTEALPFILGLSVGAGVVWVIMRGQIARERAIADDPAASNARLSDTIGQLQSKRDRALECVTPNSAHVGKKMAAILKGDA